MLTIGELATAVQLGVPLVVCVFNDGGYGILRYMQNAAYGGRLIGVDLVTPDFAVLARSVGMDSVNVSSAAAFDAAFSAAIESRRQVGALIDVKSETIRGWVERAEVDAGTRPGTTTEEQAELIRLRREVGELRRANEILKTASAFFAAAELDRRLK